MAGSGMAVLGTEFPARQRVFGSMCMKGLLCKKDIRQIRDLSLSYASLVLKSSHALAA